MGGWLLPIRYLMIAACFMVASAIATAQPRVATVIGNADYQRSQLDLANPVNDAKLMARTLQNLGFDVRLHTDLNRDQMIAVFSEHRERLETAGPETVGVFYYAGHGMQLNATNYLIPVNTQARYQEDVLYEPQLGTAIQSMVDAGNDVNVVILDACNTNPLPPRSGLGRSSSGQQGLADIDRSAGLLIAYAAQPGRQADDGQGRNSPFTAALAEIMAQEGLIAELTFKRVAARVRAETNDKQWPFYKSGLIGEDFCFNPTGCGTSSAVGRVALPTRSEAGAIAETGGEPAGVTSGGPIRSSEIDNPGTTMTTIIEPARSQRDNLLNQLNGKWARQDRDCSISMRITVEEADNGGNLVRISDDGFESLAQVIAADGGAIVTTGRSQEGRTEQWVYRPDGLRIVVTDPAGTETALTKCSV